LKRQVRPIAAPPERLDRHAEVLAEPDGVHDVPAIQAEALLRLVEAVGARDEQAGRASNSS
jgi:hypothetical protein